MKHCTVLYFYFSGEKEGAAKSLDSCQELLTESKSDNAQLLGRVHAAESQIEGLKKGKEEVNFACWVKISADDIFKYFFEIGFDISCKLHEMSKPIFWETKKNIIS